VASSLYFSFTNQYLLGGLIPIMLVPRYELSLYHTPIESDLLDFSGIGVFKCGLLDHVIKRFTSYVIGLFGLIHVGKCIYIYIYEFK
jgi:hypothetical protein